MRRRVLVGAVTAGLTGGGAAAAGGATERATVPGTRARVVMDARGRLVRMLVTNFLSSKLPPWQLHTKRSAVATGDVSPPERPRNTTARNKNPTIGESRGPEV